MCDDTSFKGKNHTMLYNIIKNSKNSKIVKMVTIVKN